jgi:hypothetical protein
MRDQLVSEPIWTPSNELNAMLAFLTAGQARGIRRIIEKHELGGKSIESLLTGEHKICNHNTFYQRWLKNKKFTAVLDLARREVRVANLSGVNEALAELQSTAPLAARDLHRQIVGDATAIEALKAVVLKGRPPADGEIDERISAVNSLADIGTSAASLALMECLRMTKNAVRNAIVAALGRSASGLSTQRRLADIAVLNRAGKETAGKGQSAADEMSDDELAAIAREADAAGRSAGTAAA